jgi:hypothetical protein
LGAGALGAVLGRPAFPLWNPLAYPERDWESIYRAQHGYDSHFHFMCAPNDTHNCLLRPT